MISERRQFLRLAPVVLLGLMGLWVSVQQVVLAGGGDGSAAAIGLFRGDLWAGRTQAAQASGLAGGAVAASASQWAASSPLSDEAWLVLAEHLPASEEARKRDVVAMAFSTAPGAAEQIPRRLAVAVGSAVITDATIERYVHKDIGYLLNRSLGGEQILREVDRLAPQLGRYRLRAMLTDISPGFAASLPAY